ncbi:MAG: hypothetical protein ACRYF2_20445 [Janthinobacterium lividum]
MRIRHTLIALLLTTGLAQAQAVSPLGGSTNNAGSPPPALATPAPPTTAAPAATTPPATATATPAPAATTHARRTMDERFAAANTTHDGKLTLEQAKAGHLRAVARDFAMIDKSKRGYVTLDEIKAHQSEQRAARKAARDAKK